MARDVKGNKKDSYRYIGSKRKPRENMGPHLNGAGNLEIKGMEKVKVFKAFFTFILLFCLFARLTMSQQLALELKDTYKTSWAALGVYRSREVMLTLSQHW